MEMITNKDSNEEVNASANDELVSQCNEYDISTITETEIPALLKDAGQLISSYAINTWAPIFSQSKEYEDYSAERFDSITEEMLRLEENLNNQKRELLEKLTLVSRSFGVTNASQE